MYFHIRNKSREQGEDDVEHLLIMSLVIGYMAIRNGFEVILQELQSPIHILLADKGCHLCDGNASLLGTLAIHVVGQEIVKQSYSYFLVRDVEGIELGILVVILDGDVSALIEQWGNGLHLFRRGIRRQIPGLL